MIHIVLSMLIAAPPSLPIPHVVDGSSFGSDTRPGNVRPVHPQHRSAIAVLVAGGRLEFPNADACAAFIRDEIIPSAGTVFVCETLKDVNL